MKPRSERFADKREWRYAHLGACVYPRAYSTMLVKGARAQNKQLGKDAAALFKAAREDRRFALVALVPKVAHDQFARSLGKEMLFAPRPARSFIDQALLPDHVCVATGAHRPENAPEKIACYPTRADAKRGRLVTMSAGKFAAATGIGQTPAEVQAWAERWVAAVKPVVIRWAAGDEPEEWSRVYRADHGFSSCMGGTKFCDDEFHPARFYARPGNGLALAWIGTDDATYARCVVNQARKKYVRVYGDARLAEALEAAGYECDSYNALRGVECNAVADGRRLVAPYLDAVGNISWDGGDSCVISSDGDWEAQCTDGFAEEQGGTSCDDCGDRMREEDATWIRGSDATVCECCLERNYTLAIVGGRPGREEEQYIRDRDVVHVGGQAFLNEYEVLEGYGLVLDEDGDWQDADDCIYLEYLSEYVLGDNCVRLDVDHGDDSYARHYDTKLVTIDGKECTVHEDYDGPEDSEEDVESEEEAAA